MDKEKTINQKYKVDECFQYAATVASNYGEIKLNPEIISNIKPFTNKYSSDKIPKEIIMFGNWSWKIQIPPIQKPNLDE